MVIARAVSKDGQELLVIGLSLQNRSLMEEFDVPVELRTYLAGERTLRLLIFAGETEDSMQAQLQRHLIAHAEQAKEEATHATHQTRTHGG